MLDKNILCNEFLVIRLIDDKNLVASYILKYKNKVKF